MGLELAAFRLYAPHFGYSTYVWGAMIGVAMVALAAGYALGGWLSDRARGDWPLYLAILCAGAWQSAVLLFADPLLRELARVGPRLGPILATLIIFVPPMLGLAMTGPYVTRLLAREGRVGTIAGAVSALSTGGSVVGVFGTSFILVPWLGTRATLITLCVLSIAIGAGGLALARRKIAAAAILPIAILFFTRPLGWTAHARWVRESPYNLVRVVERDGELLLVLNDDHSAQTTRLRGDDPWTGRYYDLFMLGPPLAPGPRTLVLGVGAGASVRAARASRSDLDVDAVEIDPEVVEAGRLFFDLREGPRQRLHVADARPWLAAQRRRWDLVQIDLFQGGLYQPFYVLTVEAFRAVRDHLAPDGVMMMNVYDGSPDLILRSTIAATLAEVFPSLYVLRAGRRNHVVIAFARERSIDDVRAALDAAALPPDIDDFAQKSARQLEPLSFEPGTEVLTDDHAPLEELTRRMIESMRR